MHYVETISLAYCIVRFVKLLPVMELCLLAAYTYNKNFMGGNVMGGSYISARQASACMVVLAATPKFGSKIDDYLQPWNVKAI